MCFPVAQESISVGEALLMRVTKCRSWICTLPAPEPLQRVAARPRNREEAGDGALGKPPELSSRGQHVRDRGAVAAEGDVLNPVAPRLEDSGGGLGSFVDQRPGLILPA